MSRMMDHVTEDVRFVLAQPQTIDQRSRVIINVAKRERALMNVTSSPLDMECVKSRDQGGNVEKPDVIDMY